MATMEMTKDNFEDTVTGNDLVFVDFWAEWCGPCKMFGPVYESVSGDHDDIVFAKVDTEAQPELASAFGIMSIPTLMIFKERVQVFSQPGALGEATLKDLVDKAKELDMDEVRAQIAEAEAAAASDEAATG